MQSFRSPKLDDRTFDDLRRELVRRIPVHSAEWTDHNAGDPGIALLEVFAWLGENLLYRLNRVPDKALLDFLNLLDVPPRPAQPSQALVRFSLGRGADTPELLPEGPTAEKTVVLAGKVELEVQGELEVLPLEARPAVKAPLDAADPSKLIGKEEVEQALEDHLGRSSTVALYTTRLLDPPEAGVVREPVPVARAVDQALWIALLVPQALARDHTPAQIRKLIEGRVLNVGVILDDSLCGPADVERCPDPGSPETSLPIVWQIATGKFAGGAPSIDKLRYERLAVEQDGTAGLSRSGVWRLRLPASADAFGTWDGAGLDEALAGAGDLPPLVDDDKLAARIVTWIRCFRPRGAADGAELPQPVVRWADVNLAPVEQAVTAAPELLGNGSGRPEQALRLSHAPVLGDTVYLEVREPSGWVAWQRVDHFGASGPGDPHYALDPVTGEIRFGDGVRGRMPRAGEAIRVRSYRYGGGVAGNVPAGAISKVRPPKGVGALQVENPFAAEGGVDAETIEEAKRRVPQVLRNHDRAVAAEDFRDIAMETPGACLGRVEVLPRHKPQERADGVPGVVTLVVVPSYDPLHPDEPVPDRETLRRVCAYLEPRRLVTTELYVTPPEYVPVWISAAFEVEDGYGAQTVRRWVELAIRQYLAPLPPYGPAGQGWPFGRAVSAPDVEAAILRVEGVRLVHAVLVEGAAGADGKAPQGKVELRSWQLPVVRGVQLATDKQAPDPIHRDGDPERPAGETPLPVPVVEEVC